jgi:hypothetical protein
MRNRSTVLFTGVTMLAALIACKKETNTNYSNGKAPVLQSSTTAIAPAPSDSLSKVVTFSWSSPSYSTDPSTVKYIIQIDSSGRNFSKAVSFVVTGALTDTLIAKQINSVLLGFGFAFNVKYSVDVRLISSYANNNEQLMSNVLTLQATPYKIPPKVPPPTDLFIIGDATAESPQWTNSPLLAPTQQFTKLDSVTFGGIFQLSSSGSYLFLPVDNGNWDHKYGGSSKTGGTLFVDGAVPGSNTPPPTASGLYKIIVDFQNGVYTVTPYSGITLPDSLFAIGDATPENPQWTNSSLLTTQNQAFTRLDNSTFQLNIALANSGGYLFLPVDNGNWDHKYGGKSATGGTLLADGDVPGSNTPPPAAAGNYKITINFLTDQYTVTAQ